MCDAQDLKPICLTCGDRGEVGGFVNGGAPGWESYPCPECSQPTTDLSRDLRACNASGNPIGAERKLAQAADAIDALVEALSVIAARNPLKSGERTLMDLALAKTELS